MLWRPYLLETGLKALQMQRYEKLFRKPPLIGTDKYIKKIKAGQRGAFMLHKGVLVIGLACHGLKAWRLPTPLHGAPPPLPITEAGGEADSTGWRQTGSGCGEGPGAES